MSNDTQTLTEEDLELTQDEADRNAMRAIFDIAKMKSNNVPDNIARVIASIRYDQTTAYGIRVLLVNDILTPCLLVEVTPGKTACLALIHDGFMLTTVEGEDMKDKGAITKFDKRTLN